MVRQAHHERTPLRPPFALSASKGPRPPSFALSLSKSRSWFDRLTTNGLSYAPRSP